MRQLLIIAKVCPSVDPALDKIVSSASRPRDIFSLVDPGSSGRGLLHWACWYDPWLLGNDVSPDSWGLELASTALGDALWEISLSCDWSAVEAGVTEKRQWEEQAWVFWQLWQAYNAYRPWNHASRLLFGRDHLGGSLDDHEVLGEQHDSGDLPQDPRRFDV